MLKETLETYGLDEKSYQDCFALIYDKVKGKTSITWQEIVDRYDLPIVPDTLRKSSSTVFGGVFLYDYITSCKEETVLNDEEKIKAREKDNRAEINKLTRKYYRKENFYEIIRDSLNTLEVPEVMYDTTYVASDKEYILPIADIHGGANFKSANNEYSLEIMAERLSKLLSELRTMIIEEDIPSMKVILMGDEIQGMLRITDVKLNETAVVEAVVHVSRVLADFLNKLSMYVGVDVYYVPTSNHNQTRPLGTKASELAAEDMSYIIGNYIKDSLINNPRVRVNLNFGEEYIEIPIFDFNTIALHGHQIKNIKESIKSLSFFNKKIYDYVFLAHFHGGCEYVVGETDSHDNEVIVVSSLVGSDKYSDKLMLGSKSSCKVHIFDREYGRIGSRKFILN